MSNFNNCKFGTGAKGFRLVEENASVYGSGCKYYVIGANNVNDTYEIVVTDGQDYSSRVDLL